MKISVWNKKGGVGKTPICVSLAIDKKLKYYTNENSIGLTHCQDATLLWSNETRLNQIKQELDKEVLIKRIDSNLELEQDCIFDFGGFYESSMNILIMVSDWVLVPTYNDLDSSLKTIETIETIEKIGNKNIIIIATRLESDKDIQDIEMLKKYCGYPIFKLKYSKVFNNIKITGMGLDALYNENALSQRAYRAVKKQYDLLWNFLIE